MTTSERRALIKRERMRLVLRINAAKARYAKARKHGPLLKLSSTRGDFRGGKQARLAIARAHAALEGFQHAVNLFSLHGGL